LSKRVTLFQRNLLINQCIRVVIFLVLISALNDRLIAQPVSSPFFPSDVKPLRNVAYFGTVIGAVGGLYLFADDAYYQDKVVGFHWARGKNGSLDWFDNYHRGIDKFGHIYSTSLFSEHFYFQARWSGFNNRQASWLAFGSSLFILGAMEVWDGHFKSWGFSVGDFTANMLGASWPVLQHNISWFSRFDYKMSYNLFASKSADPGVHDYEHMTFWLTFYPWTESLPKWSRYINIAIGYGLESYRSQQNEIYISFDYNLKQIKPKNPWLMQLVRLLDRFHLPAPGIRIHPDYVAYGLFF